ncbi:DUF1963 domain-containing protein [Actinokineospora diospyrosa]|nr:DUF1963 domain-containing protein [Actinokineospora diospyrosa]
MPTPSVPGIEAHARTATRLHPLAGTPTSADSHVGGPMRWPADEPWPYCADPLPDGSLGQALLGTAQFYCRDFPMLPFPAGRDLLQVFWCPAVYDGRHHHGYEPIALRLFWRDSTTLNGPDLDQPEPVLVDEEAVPDHACALRPCQVTEYPHSYDAELLGFEPGDDWPELAAGSKIGGWMPWWQSGPTTFPCRDCGTDSVLMLSLHTEEANDGCSCETDETTVGWQFGRDGALNILVCPNDVEHRPTPWID